MRTFNTKDIGRIGEEKALKWLLKNNYKIVEKNFRRRGFEIDIVALDGEGILRFVEVKTVDKGSIHDAVFSVEGRNISRYVLGIDAFLMVHPEYKDSVISMDALIVCNDETHYYQNITSGLLM